MVQGIVEIIAFVIFAEGLDQLAVTVLHIGCHIEVLASLAAFMDANGLEVFQEQVFVFVVQHGQHGIGIHVELSVKQDVPHASVVYQADVLVIVSAIIPGYVIGIVLVVYIHNAVFFFAFCFRIQIGQRGDGFDAIRVSGGLCRLGRFRAGSLVFFIVEHVAHTVADGASGLRLLSRFCARSAAGGHGSSAVRGLHSVRYGCCSMGIETIPT